MCVLRWPTAETLSQESRKWQTSSHKHRACPLFSCGEMKDYVRKTKDPSSLWMERDRQGPSKGWKAAISKRPSALVCDLRVISQSLRSELALLSKWITIVTCVKGSPECSIDLSILKRKRQGQNSLSCSQQDKVSVTFLQILLSFLDIFVFLLLSGLLSWDILLAGWPT